MPGSPSRGLGLRLLKELGGILAILWGAATIAFIAVKAVPGDPVAIISGGENVVDEATRAAITERFGLDQPVILQYFHYLANAARGDFGTSYQYRQPVTEVLAEALGPTSQLALSALALAVVLALLAALGTAGRPGILRTIASGAELILLSTPVYWIGILLLAIFSFGLGWFPVTGGDGPAALVLPAVALSLPLAATLAQVLRDGLEQALAQPFALTARTRGLSRAAVVIRHALRHASLSSTTVAGTMLAGVLGGSVLTETVFGRPGIGQVALTAIRSRDMPVILGLVMFSALIFVLVHLATEALYVAIDPRLRPSRPAVEVSV